MPLAMLSNEIFGNVMFVRREREARGEIQILQH